MIRLNYLRPDRRYDITLLATVIRRPTFRRSLGVYAIALAFVLLAWGVEAWRLARAEAELVDLKTRFEELTAQRLRAEQIVKHVAVLGAVEGRIAAARASGSERAGELIAIGNELPRDVWIDAIRPELGGWRVQGHATSVAALGAAVGAIRRTHQAEPSLRSMSRGSGTTLTYDLQVSRAEPVPSPEPTR